MNDIKNSNMIIIAIIIGVFVGGLIGAIAMMIVNEQKSEAVLIKEFYDVENAALASPHHIRNALSKGDTSFILVDLRSHEEYLDEHIATAVNIPAYKSKFKSAYDEVDRIVGSFDKLIRENPGKDIIVYCYSVPCMTGRKIGKMLSEHGIFVKHLGIGWNEWRYYWNMWNHEHDWNETNVMDYIASGHEPGIVKAVDYNGTCTNGKFSC